jgi:hypothetical protein
LLAIGISDSIAMTSLQADLQLEQAHPAASQLPEILTELLRERLQYRSLYEAWVETQILHQAALERGLSLPEEVIQAEGDRQRHELKLERADETLAWLAHEQVTPDQWEQGIKDKLLRSLLTEHLFAGEVDRIFAENKLNYERRAVYCLEFSDLALAQEIFYQIEDQEISFFEAAYLYSENPEQADRCGFQGLLHRWELPKAHVHLIFEAQAQQILSPIASSEDNHYVLYWIGRINPAELTPEIRQQILDELFNQWLAGEIVRWLHYHVAI